MGKEKKKGLKANVFKVAGAKSLKKTKAKSVNLQLKNIKQKIVDIDKQLKEIKSNPNTSTSKPKIQGPQKKEMKMVTKEEVLSTSEQINKMDL